jgi:Uma2 family endonuclease
MVVQERLMTAEEFAAIPDDGKRHDLVKGIVVEVSRPKMRHGILQQRFARFIGGFADENNLGMTTTESGFIVARNPDTVRGPDVAFISRARLGNYDIDEYIPGGPDLVVEIVSPNDTATEVNDKIEEYFRAGSHLVWVVYPRKPEVYAYSGSSTNVQIIGIDSTLDGADVLPGFTLPLREVFKGLGEQQGNQL